MIARRLSLLGVLLVTVSAALPFSTCTSYVDDAGQGVEVEPGAPLPEGVHAEVDVRRPIYDFDLRDLDMYPFMVAFLWPIALLGIRALWPRARRLRTISALEGLLILGSGWVFYGYSSIGDRAWGAYVAFVGLAFYAGGFVTDLVSRRGEAPR